MKIKRLYIKDFGLLRNQTLDQIGSGLVVIGGPNRAGKTTLLNIFRYLPYGFPQADFLPPPDQRYGVEAELELEPAIYAKIFISGFAEPEVAVKSGGSKKRKARELYNGLDQFTYQQLFTLTLDELKKIPDGINGKNYERLQTVLLGAGLSDIILLPQLEEYFKKEAEKIGGKYGNPSVCSFKPYYQAIEKGQQLRDEAAKQIELYHHNSQQQKEIGAQIKNLAHKREKTQNTIVLLDLLKNNYQNYSEMKKIELQLAAEQNKKLLTVYSPEKQKKALDFKERYTNSLKMFAEKDTYIKKLINKENKDDIIPRIIEKQGQIVSFQQEVSGLKERIKNYFALLAELSELKSQLKTEINRINENWQEEPERILQLKTDHIAQYNLHQTIDEYLTINNKIKEMKEEISRLNQRKKILQEEINQVALENPVSRLRKFYYLALIFILIGILTSLANPQFIFISFTGIIAIALYFFYRRGLDNTQRSLLNTKQNELKEVVLQLAAIEPAYTKNLSLFAVLKENIKEFKDVLELDPETPTEVVKDIFREVQYLKKEIYNIKKREEIALAEKNGLEHEINKIKSLLLFFADDFFDHPTDQNEGILEIHQQLFIKLERLLHCLDYALEYESYRIAKENLETSILSLLSDQLPTNSDFIDCEQLLFQLADYIKNGEKAEQLLKSGEIKNNLRLQILQALKTDRLSSALTLNHILPEATEENNLFAVFEKLNQNYSSLTEIKKDYRQNQELLQEISVQLDSKKRFNEELTINLQDLLTTKKMEEARRLIDQGRSGLQPLAEKYATYQTAAFILKHVKNSLLKNTADPLRSASDYFRKITTEEYSAILPPEDLTLPDYRVVNKAGIIQEDTDILSKATKEQLFLAVRISRIREISPPLPVIIDDTFVNFDDYHLSNTVDLISDLASTHQIFILTCHPHLIKKFVGKGYHAQYWMLDAGKFSQVKYDHLISFLMQQ